MVRVSKIDDVFMKVHCDDGLARDLYDFFSFTVPNAKFMPSYKNKFWDGKVRLFSIKTKKIYIGLLPYVDEFCRERGFEFGGIEEVIGSKTKITDEDVDFFINGDDLIPGLGLPFQPRDYQIDAFKTAVQYGRQLLLSPTASGKSLIIYMLCRWYEGEMSLPNAKTVIIVPTTSLVEQMSKDLRTMDTIKRFVKFIRVSLFLIRTSQSPLGSHLPRLLRMSWKVSTLSSETKHTSSKHKH